MMRAAITLMAALAALAHGVVGAQTVVTVREGQQISAKAGQHIWYGAPGTWMSKVAATDGLYDCTNAAFRRDPIPRGNKQCRVSAYSAAPGCAPSTVGGLGGPVRVSIGITLIGVNAYIGWRCPAGTVAYVCSGMGCVNGLLVPPEDASVSAMHAAAIKQIEAQP